MGPPGYCDPSMCNAGMLAPAGIEDVKGKFDITIRL